VKQGEEDMKAQQNIWRVMCQTRHHPGQWQSWYREQCCAVGWPPPEFNYDKSTTTGGSAWSAARNALHEMKAGDPIVAVLPDGRIGRVGEIVRLEVADAEWNPIVPRSSSLPNGENGRRILLRWDLSIGSMDPNVVAQLPRGRRNFGQNTITRLSRTIFDELCATAKNPDNWVSLHATFDVEAALSDYIAMHPHRLEDGLVTHPALPVREFQINAKSRIDVVLQDRSGQVVLVECKQDGVTSAHLDQVNRYLGDFRVRYPEWEKPRGILVHGGARMVSSNLRDYAAKLGIALAHHDLRVDFSVSG
jgi:hypothetical protein